MSEPRGAGQAGGSRPLASDVRPTVTLPQHDAEPRAGFSRRLERRVEAGYRLAALILGNPSDAEDATHEAVLMAWSRSHTLRDPAAFDAWFDRILVNLCRDRLRRGRILRMVDLEAAGEEHAADPYGVIGARDLIGRSFARLGPDHKIAVVLRFWVDLTIEEIAERTGARPGTIKSRLHYALAAMREALDESGETGP